MLGSERALHSATAQLRVAWEFVFTQIDDRTISVKFSSPFQIDPLSQYIYDTIQHCVPLSWATVVCLSCSSSFVFVFVFILFCFLVNYFVQIEYSEQLMPPWKLTGNRRMFLHVFLFFALTTHRFELIFMLWINRSQLQHPYFIITVHMAQLSQTTGMSFYLVTKRGYFTETRKQTVQPRAPSLSVVWIGFGVWSCNYSLVVSRLRLIPLSLLYVAVRAWREWKRHRAGQKLVISLCMP